MLLYLKNLSEDVGADAIRNYFKGIHIPAGGIHITRESSCFISFENIDELTRAFSIEVGSVLGRHVIKLLCSEEEKELELQRIEEEAERRRLDEERLKSNLIEKYKARDRHDEENKYQSHGGHDQFQEKGEAWTRRIIDTRKIEIVSGSPSKVNPPNFQMDLREKLSSKRSYGREVIMNSRDANIVIAIGNPEATKNVTSTDDQVDNMHQSSVRSSHPNETGRHSSQESSRVTEKTTHVDKYHQRSKTHRDNRERDRDRDRDRDRNGDRDRGRDRGRDRERERDKDRERDRDKERDRERDKDRYHRGERNRRSSERHTRSRRSRSHEHDFRDEKYRSSSKKSRSSKERYSNKDSYTSRNLLAKETGQGTEKKVDKIYISNSAAPGHEDSSEKYLILVKNMPKTSGIRWINYFFENERFIPEATKLICSENKALYAYVEFGNAQDQTRACQLDGTKVEQNHVVIRKISTETFMKDIKDVEKIAKTSGLLTIISPEPGTKKQDDRPFQDIPGGPGLGTSNKNKEPIGIPSQILPSTSLSQWSSLVEPGASFHQPPGHSTLIQPSMNRNLWSVPMQMPSSYQPLPGHINNNLQPINSNTRAIVSYEHSSSSILSPPPPPQPPTITSFPHLQQPTFQPQHCLTLPGPDNWIVPLPPYVSRLGDIYVNSPFTYLLDFHFTKNLPGSVYPPVVPKVDHSTLEGISFFGFPSRDTGYIMDIVRYVDRSIQDLSYIHIKLEHTGTRWTIIASVKKFVVPALPWFTSINGFICRVMHSSQDICCKFCKKTEHENVFTDCPAFTVAKRPDTDRNFIVTQAHNCHPDHTTNFSYRGRYHRSVWCALSHPLGKITDLDANRYNELYEIYKRLSIIRRQISFCLNHLYPSQDILIAGRDPVLTTGIQDVEKLAKIKSSYIPGLNLAGKALLQLKKEKDLQFQEDNAKKNVIGENEMEPTPRQPAISPGNSFKVTKPFHEIAKIQRQVDAPKLKDEKDMLESVQSSTSNQSSLNFFYSMYDDDL